MDNRARAPRAARAGDLHDRLIGFKAEERGREKGEAEEGGPFSRLRKENGSGFITLHSLTSLKTDGLH